MTRRTASQLAWSLVALAALMHAAALAILARSGPPTGTFEVVSPTTVGAQIAIGLGFLVFTLIGALIVSKHPEHRIGWLFGVAGTALALANLTSSYAYHALDTDRGSLPGGAAMGVLGDALWLPDLAFTSVFLFLLFPSGRLTTRWERVTAHVAVAAVAASFLGGLTEPTLYAAPTVRNPLPFATPEWVTGLLESIGFFSLIPCVASSVILLVKRFRRSTGELRQQMKWFVYAAALVFVFFVPSNVLDSPPLLLQLAAGLSIVSLPVSVGIAILKHRLYDIDVVIRRTVVVGALAGFITVVYVGVVVGAGTLLGRTQADLALQVAATALVALAFQPVRERARRLANRLVYGERAEPYEVLARFASRAAGTYATEDVLPRAARVIGEGTGAVRAEVWLRVGNELRVGGAWPEDAEGERPGTLPLADARIPVVPGATELVPVQHRGDLLGVVAVAKPPGEPLTPAEDALLRDLAKQAGFVLRNVRLTEELQVRLEQISAQAEQLRASRQRIVAAHDAERRRLERNIHDGAQQHLVALAVKLRLARDLLSRDAERATGLLQELRAEIDLALETLRDLARGIYPAVLEERGIVAALQAQAGLAGVPVRVEADGLARRPIETEAAVYFACLEALQNAVKHARAREVRIRLAEVAGRLSFSVRDDGRGFDPAAVPGGSGLRNMADRVEALGGHLEVRSAPGRGTTVEGEVPMNVPERAP
ncbi:MAG TPA: ATP-binding protein [Actinomycetota bacterium]|nr:ATP-binding protein [Actinomycetota bacterium]